MKAILQMFNSLKGREKWVIVGDMLEQGNQEQEEHEKLAELLATYHFDHIILMGPRVERYTLPKLQKLFVKRGKRIPVVSFLTPTEVMVYLLSNLAGNEAILFKGARFLEGVIERLLKNKSDAKFLARREEIWEKRRKEWGL